MCWKCGRPADIAPKPGFRDLCPACGRELHVCRNCAFYSPGAHHDCLETVPDPVFDKERGNLCEYFRPNTAIFSAEGRAVNAADSASRAMAAKDAFDRLFGKD
jgi:hypothetical protein